MTSLWLTSVLYKVTFADINAMQYWWDTGIIEDWYHQAQDREAH